MEDSASQRLHLWNSQRELVGDGESEAYRRVDVVREPSAENGREGDVGVAGHL